MVPIEYGKEYTLEEVTHLLETTLDNIRKLLYTVVLEPSDGAPLDADIDRDVLAGVLFRPQDVLLLWLLLHDGRYDTPVHGVSVETDKPISRRQEASEEILCCARTRLRSD
jgi:hypothetical protein